MIVHKPVLVKEVLQYLNPRQNENFIDATIGQGGHAIGILKSNGPQGFVLGIDLDSEQIENSKIMSKEFKGRVFLVNDSYVHIKEIAEKMNLKPVNGILLDLGMSSWHLEESGRGFSFKKNEPLDMRYNLQNIITAERIVNQYPQKEIEKILRDYGQEKFSRQIAREIERQRRTKKIKSTFELKSVIERAIPAKFRHGQIHCATRAFQALRIATNEELDNLKEVLPKAIELLSFGGRLVVISFHSLEDKIVKDFFKSKEKNNLFKILTRKPIVPTLKEKVNNPRSGSAKLRAIMKY